MRRLRFLLQKEFLQIFRNKSMLPIIFVMPVIQLLILGFAATLDLREIKMGITDHSHSSDSRKLVHSLTSGGYFKLKATPRSTEEAIELIDRSEISMWINIPQDFHTQMYRTGSTQIQVLVDAVDGYTAGLIQNYLVQIISSFQPVHVDLVMRNRGMEAMPKISQRYWYNTSMEYSWYMVPGIIVVLVTMIGAFLSSMNIVREREIGTMEQLNVTPIPKSVFIAGKLIPFWVIGLFELAFGLFVARIVFGIPLDGNPILVFGSAAVYLLGMLGMGLLVSTVTDTQQQAMLISWFILVVFILMGGLFTPIESMPEWAQSIADLNPVAWFIRLMRQVLLKGAGIGDVIYHIGFMTGFAVLMMVLAINRFKKSVG